MKRIPNFLEQVTRRLTLLGLLCGGSVTVCGEELVLEAFPQSDRVWLGTENVRVSFVNQKRITTSVKSEITVEIGPDEWVEDGGRWGTVDAKALQLEEKGYVLSLEKSELEKEKLIDDEKEKLEEINETTEELVEKKRIYQELLQEDGISENNKKRALKAMGLIDEEIETVNDHENRTRITKEFAIKRRELELSLEKEKRRLAKVRKDAILTAPFSGRVEYLSEQLEYGKAVWIDQGVDLVKIVDNRHVDLEFSPALQANYTVPLEQIFVSYTCQLGSFDAAYKEKETYQSAGKERQRWIFRFAEDDLAEVSTLVGESRMSHVFWKLPQRAYIVPKKALANRYGNRLKTENWKSLAESIWSRCKVLRVAPRELVILREVDKP